MSEIQQCLTLDSPAHGGSDQGLVRCLSLWQPWASLMACGAKRLETRSWNTKVRETVHIHASQTQKGIKQLIDESTASQAGWDKAARMQEALGIPIGQWKHKLPFGQIIARGELVETYTTEQALWQWLDQKPFGDFMPERFAHRYEKLTAIELIPWKGAQGFFFAKRPPNETSAATGSERNAHE